MIAFNKFVFWFYKETFQLKNDDEIQIPKTGIVLIHGKSGHGKSTLFNALLYRKTRKKIINLNSNIAVFKTEEIVPSNYLVSDLLLTVGKGVLKHDTIDLLNIRELLAKNTKSLSGGEKSRVRLAMLLESNANVLLLDEPHIMVDKDKVEGEIQAIKKASENKLIFVVTHYPELYNTPYRIKVENGALINESKKEPPKEVEPNIQMAKASMGLIGKRVRKESLFQTISAFLSLFISLSLFVFTTTVMTFSSLSNVKPDFDTFGEGYKARTVSISSLGSDLSNNEKEEFFSYADASLFEKYYKYELIDKGYPPQPEFLLETKLEEKDATINFISPIDNFYNVKGNIDVIESFGKTTDLAQNEIVLATKKEALELNNFRGIFTTLTGHSGTEYEALKSIDWDTQTLTAKYIYKDFGSVQTTIDFTVCGIILTGSYVGYYSDNGIWDNETIINNFFDGSTIVEQKPTYAIDKPYILKTLFARYTGLLDNVESSVEDAINDSDYDLTYYVNVNDGAIVAINSKNKVFTKQKIANMFGALPSNLTINNYLPYNLSSRPLVEWNDVNSRGFVGISSLSFTNANEYQTLGYQKVIQSSSFSLEDNYFVMSKELANRYYSQRESKISYGENELNTLIGETFDFGAFSLKLGAIVIDKAYPELSFAITNFNHLLTIDQYYFCQTYDILVDDYMHVNTVMNYYANESLNRGSAHYDFDIARIQSAIDKYENYKALITNSTISSLIIAGITVLVVLGIYIIILRIIRKNDNFFANVNAKKNLLKMALIRFVFPLWALIIAFVISPVFYSMVQDSFINTFTSFAFNNSLGGINLNNTLLINSFPTANGIMIIIILIPALITAISALIRINPRERSNY